MGSEPNGEKRKVTKIGPGCAVNDCALQVLQVLQIEIRNHARSTSPAPRLSREPRSPARCPKTEGTNSRTQERHSSTAEIPHTSTHLSHEQSNRFPEPDAGTALAKTHPHLTHEQVRTAGRRNGRDTHPAGARQKAVEGKGSSQLNGRSGYHSSSRPPTPMHLITRTPYLQAHREG